MVMETMSTVNNNAACSMETNRGAIFPMLLGIGYWLQKLATFFCDEDNIQKMILLFMKTIKTRPHLFLPIENDKLKKILLCDVQHIHIFKTR
jgi:hypothetical protein